MAQAAKTASKQNFSFFKTQTDGLSLVFRSLDELFILTFFLAPGALKTEVIPSEPVRISMAGPENTADESFSGSLPWRRRRAVSRNISMFLQVGIRRDEMILFLFDIPNGKYSSYYAYEVIIKYQIDFKQDFIF
ncbi:hypothetical protein [Flavobacterium anhuiense]|uniref:hypothetical protein n=1 Tax=Flavobacterium anhuiense TaxID=459526 RepID=UPI000E6CBA24|nr:hypothetical protein [Flavobacterium anhuiense]